ncbi:homoserine kinase [Enterococcus montenegrensis]|uniref:homoserine kinase n=1 Tax=Enterococcus TaxID=1350 RepID=UPI001E59B00C|nr:MULTISPECIES: homoserine kinase [Enterococcus]MCD1023648.1 homoserine kinase [Enterococcus sp. SMC-9]WHA08398.1 homoserine kinase [Enterococcus montenegrensis]
MRIRVPATSANLGPGFDSCGVAVSCYLFVEVVKPAITWQVEHSYGDFISSDASNLIVQTALKTAPNLLPHHIKVTSDIPLTRGLGSSSSAIVAGIELANRLGNLELSESDKIKLATEMEGHPDNVAPAICGDLVVASYHDDKTYYLKHYFPDCDLIAFIPNTELATSESRDVLPTQLSYSQAVTASSIANVMVAALMAGNLAVAGKMMEQDQFHEQYRSLFVPHLAKIREISHAQGGFGCYLSGAGPTVIILAPKNKTAQIIPQLKMLDKKATIEIFQVDREGVQVF